jgi:hypothetical protein
MTLHFIYIQNYEDIFKNINFNLGGAFRFNYDHTIGALEVHENPFFTENFFNLYPNRLGENQAVVQNVSAIIGALGAGKTAFLTFIKSNFVRGMGGISTPIIVALTTNEGERKIYCDANIQITNLSADFQGFTIHIIGQEEKRYAIPGAGIIHATNKPEIEELANTDFIYLSTIFDNNVQYEFEGLHNISTDYLLLNDFKSRKEVHEEWGTNINSEYSETQVHKSEEIHRQLDLINSDIFKKHIPFDTPNRISISIAKDLLFSKEDELGLHPSTMLQSYGYSDFIKEFKKYSIFRYQESIDSKDRALIYFTANAVLNHIFEIAILTRYYKISFLESAKFDISLPYDETYDFIIESLQDDLKRFKTAMEENKRNYDPYPRDLDQILALRDLFKYITINISSDNIGDKGNIFLITNRDEKDDIGSFFKIYRRTFTFDPYLNFSWYDLSSGQKVKATLGLLAIENRV